MRQLIFASNLAQKTHENVSKLISKTMFQKRLYFDTIYLVIVQKEMKILKIGYARVSTKDQNLDMQIDALKQNGCEKIYMDKITGAKKERLEFDRALDQLRKGDTLVVWKLDRAGRSLKHLIELVEDLDGNGVGFISLKENIDTTTSTGKLVFHIFAALAEFERDIIRERTHAGLNAARARGRVGGRPRLMDDKKVAMAKTMMNDKNIPVKDICKALGVSRATLYRVIKED
jgi:DNA invertase Pin-like site-specific DNA recombinase